MRSLPTSVSLPFLALCALVVACLAQPGVADPSPALVAPLTARTSSLTGIRRYRALPIVVVPPEGTAAKHRKPAKIPAKYDIGQIGHREVGAGINFYSLDKEIALGRELSAEIESECRLLNDPVVGEYINRVGQNLVRNSDAKVPFTIKIIENDEVNAVALPGGFFYINTGLILAAEDEAELAGVMAHEIAHVAARHATHNMTRSNLFNLASIPLVFIGGPAGFALREAAGIGMPMGFLKFSRDAEREADLLGMEYQYAAGYDPAAMVQFFERLKVREKKKEGMVARAFSTHPMTEERIRRAQQEMDNMLPPRDEYVVTTSEFDRIKARVAKLLGTPVLKNAEDKPTLRRATQSDRDGDQPVLRK